MVYDNADAQEGAMTEVVGGGCRFCSDHWYDVETLDVKYFPYHRMNELVPVGAVLYRW